MTAIDVSVPRMSGSTLTGEVVHNIETALAERSPFPHIVIDNLLPADFFEDLKLGFPSEGHFGEGSISSKSRRNLMDRSPAQAAFLAVSPAWSEFDHLVRGGALRDAVVDKFLPETVKAGGSPPSSSDWQAKYDIACAGLGYARNCHLDRRHHFVAMLLYMNGADDTDFAGEGGDFLLFKSQNQAAPFDKFPHVTDDDIAKMIEPKANRFVAFLNTSWAYHGITPISKAKGFRKFLYMAIETPGLTDIWPATYVADEKRRQAFLSQ